MDIFSVLSLAGGLALFLYGIAVFHSLFNVTVTILLFPFLNQLVKLATVTIRDKDKAEAELGVIIQAVNEVTALTEKAMADNRFEELSDVEPLEQVIDNLTKTVREHHIARLRDGACTMELGYILADITANLERISDHCSNLASSWMMAETGGYDTHRFLTEYRRIDNEAFRQRFTKMSLRYNL